MNAIQLIPKCELSFRLATMADFPAIDALQKKYQKGLGFFPRGQMEGYINGQWLLIAEDATTKKLLGYCASRDQYRKRDELGIIYQMCVEPGAQRKLVAAALLREVFARSAYGCRLYCCWCAKDLDANYFWEAMGFVPIAFRAGSEKKARVHIFWQKRIVAGDVETKWWYPYKTEGGAMGANRIAFPIPPGVSWKHVEAVAMPNGADGASPLMIEDMQKRGRAARATKKTPVLQTPTVMRMQFGPPGGKPIVSDAEKPAPKVKREPTCPERSRRKPKEKLDPKYITAARELRDRWMEQVNNDPMMLTSTGKYDVARAIEAPRINPSQPLLNAA